MTLHKLTLILLCTSALFASDTAYKLASSSNADHPLISIISNDLDIHSSKNQEATNIQRLKDAEVDFAIVNGDDALEAFKSDDTLRSVISLYPKVLTLVTKKGSHFTSLLDLKSKAMDIHIDIVGSDTENTVKTVFQKLKLPIPTSIKTFAEAQKRLIASKSDAFIVLVAHPNAQIKRLDETENIAFIPLVEKRLDQLKNEHPSFLKSGIPEGMYSLESDLKSIAIKAVLITRANVDKARVYKLTKTILSHCKALKAKHLIYRNSSRKFSLEGLSIPQHEGAIKAFNASTNRY